ncbi:MAG: glycosyltransferase family 4 protein [Thermoanaerobaculia bacterium]
MSRVLLLCPEPGRAAMAGVGIRFWEMARHLGRRHEVRLGFPNDVADLAGAAALAEARVVRYDAANIAELARWSEVVVLHAHVSNLYLDHAGAREPRPLVVDLYDPFPIENLNYYPQLGDGPYRHDRVTLERQLRAGDLFLCSSAEQRLFYLGMLYALGRLNPETYFADFTLANLVREVPFGIRLPDASPDPRPLLRGVVPGIGAEDPILFFGGIYDWYDPMLLLAILPALLAHFPALRLVFSANPNTESTPQATYAEVVAVAREAGWLDRHVFFVPWVAADERFNLYREATVAVVLHRARFEAEISLRTRVLDFLGAGLAVVATAGGTMSRLLAEEEMGSVVAEGDSAALTEAVRTLLSSPDLRAGFAERGRKWAARHDWATVLAPLEAFLDRPHIDPHKDRYPPGSIPPPRPPRRFGRAFWRSRLGGS